MSGTATGVGRGVRGETGIQLVLEERVRPDKRRSRRENSQQRKETKYRRGPEARRGKAWSKGHGPGCRRRR